MFYFSWQNSKFSAALSSLQIFRLFDQFSFAYIQITNNKTLPFIIILTLSRLYMFVRLYIFFAIYLLSMYRSSSSSFTFSFQGLNTRKHSKRVVVNKYLCSCFNLLLIEVLALRFISPFTSNLIPRNFEFECFDFIKKQKLDFF